MTVDPTTAPGERPSRDLLRGASLFLDFDGTLVEIAPTPDEIVVSSELRRLLERLSDRLDGRIAILTGRHSAEVEKLIKSVRLTIGGHHGLETRSGGRTISAGNRPEALDAVIEELRGLARKHPGVLVEEKPLGVALHFRGAPSAEEACRTAIAEAARVSGLVIQPGKMVLELRPGGSDKGDALRRIASEPPFRGSRPLFLGDDLTDEPAFVAARALGGAGILVGDPRPTSANYRIGSVAETLTWLDEACERA